MALVAKQPDLLPGLVVAYAAGGAHLRAAIGAHAGALALALGPSHSALLAQLRAPVPGSEDLLLVMLHVSPPSPFYTHLYFSHCFYNNSIWGPFR